jgi:hypothetical protein
MPDDPSLDPSTDAPTDRPVCSPCRSLRNKGMYVYQGGDDSGHDDDDNTIYWCVKTQKGFGPDDEMVSREDCTIPERTCYEPL